MHGCASKARQRRIGGRELAQHLQIEGEACTGDRADIAEESVPLLRVFGQIPATSMTRSTA
jgi:hypothetical protein